MPTLEPPHLTYARRCVAGEEVVGYDVKLACARALNDHARDDRWIFNADIADRACAFLESLPHTKGRWATRGEKLRLEDWQRFIVCEVYGWVDKDDGARRYRHALIEVARKNGKTFLAAGLGLMELITGDAGGEVYMLATNREQAKVCYDAAIAIRNKSAALYDCKERYHKLEYGGSRLATLSKESRTFDGLNPSLAIVDEAGAIHDRYLIEVLETGMGARVEPLMIYTTTAYARQDTAYYELREHLRSVLRGDIDDDRVFGMLYGHDKDDDISDPQTWRKANPNLDVSVVEAELKDSYERTINIPAQAQNWRCKRLNSWTGAATNWINPETVSSVDRRPNARRRMLHRSRSGDRARPRRVRYGLATGRQV